MLNIPGASGQQAQAAVIRFLSGSATILVLDNFESPWEPHGTRIEVEEVLGRIADIKNLTLVITMRGVERPKGIAWSKPFFPPLQPLSSLSSRHIFVDITDSSVAIPFNEDDHDHDEDDHASGSGTLPPSPTASVGCEAHGDHWHCDGPATAAGASATTSSGTASPAESTGGADNLAAGAVACAMGLFACLLL